MGDEGGSGRELIEQLGLSFGGFFLGFEFSALAKDLDGAEVTICLGDELAPAIDLDLNSGDVGDEYLLVGAQHEFVAAGTHQPNGVGIRRGVATSVEQFVEQFDQLDSLPLQYLGRPQRVGQLRTRGVATLFA